MNATLASITAVMLMFYTFSSAWDVIYVFLDGGDRDPMRKECPPIFWASVACGAARPATTLAAWYCLTTV